MWDEVDMDNRLVVEQFLDSLTTASDKTHMRYRIDVRQLVYWIHSALNDKPLYRFTCRDLERYLQVMRTNGSSISTMQSKKYAICSFFRFVDEVIKNVDPRYADFVNDFKNAEIQTGVYNGKSYPVTYDEYQLLIERLRMDGYLLATIWVMFSYTTGAKNLDYRKIRSEMLKYPFPDGADYVLTNTVTHRDNSVDNGYGVNFKIRRDVYDAMKAWVDSRGYESEYLFTSLQHGKASVVHAGWATALCLNLISPILGRSVTPTDFQKGWESYMKEEERINKDKSYKQLKNLIAIDLTSQTISLSGYEREVKRIIDNL